MQLLDSLHRYFLTTLAEPHLVGGPQFDTGIANGRGHLKSAALALQGSVHRFDRSLQLSSTIATPEARFTVLGFAGRPVVEIPAEF